MSRTVFLFVMLSSTLTLIGATHLRADDSILDGKKRVVFLGDSNTFAGTYVAYVEAVLRQHHSVEDVEILNVGLSSETTSGLSEPDHPFPRPTVHERLDRVLAKVNPDLVIAGYGINDGMYYPFAEERFVKYQEGIKLLVKKVKASGADVVLLTPSPFDPTLQRKQGKLRPKGSDKYAWFGVYENYDDVMARYAEWILTSKVNVEAVVDIRTPLVSRVDKARVTDPGFALSGDGVHFVEEGHRIVAKAILEKPGYDYRERDADVLKLVTQKQKILRDAWLTETGHKRPGIKAGLPIDQAKKKAISLDTAIMMKIRNG